ncbi:pirin family protein [Frateuria aurantia]|uniref:Pirin-related protein n=1 Tax=Frateuria aurantia (strain ATCC 33424 / DSM 6220 / KCTC 2777 / LMG 1558 / NBRC 3245 / NCIMB 13370) TaxID=767434 RepID=H8KYE2_FRAAD|nr:pirin family protein [Frateuria aurantia]AFC86946.1 Pirin-related protein [Frateuria aurantia DSM 6220]
MPTIAPLQRANHGSHFRAFGLRGVASLIDPFIGVDHAWMSGPTFPPHPHAGFSAVSYVFLDSETGINNRDSIGTQNLIRPGGLHWTTAGRGIVHEEVPAETGKMVHSLQIFVDLPAEQRHVEPFPLILEPQDTPVIHMPGIKVRVPLGSYRDARSPLTPPTDVTMLDISIEAGAELMLPVPPGHVAFVLPVFGTALVDGESFNPNDLRLPVFTAQETSQEIKLRANDSCKAMLFAGWPLLAARA